MPASAVFTFGYEGLNTEAFIDRLKDARVTLIVDVRELPLSRKEGFSKTAFRERLEAAGIAYMHVTALGCPKAIRDQCRTDVDWAAYTRAFIAHLSTVQAEVRALAVSARTQRACLVCFEADHDACHRTFVARAARTAGGPPVLHLGDSAVVDEAQSSLVAGSIGRDS